MLFSLSFNINTTDKTTFFDFFKDKQCYFFSEGSKQNISALILEYDYKFLISTVDSLTPSIKLLNLEEFCEICRNHTIFFN